MARFLRGPITSIDFTWPTERKMRWKWNLKESKFKPRLKEMVNFKPSLKDLEAKPPKEGSGQGD